LASFYEAGCGYGGSCLPKDVAALTARGAEAGVPMRVLTAVAEVNQDQPGKLVDLVRDGLGGVTGRRVTVLGLAFKPDTDDVRFSPAFPVIRALLAEGAQVTAHDPVVGPDALGGLTRGTGADVAHTHDLAEAVAGADAVVLVTRWRHYDQLPGLVATGAGAPLVVDGRRVVDPDAVSRYAGIGR
jgi:UDPglucose 6-dehydrogenase/GDP-mannose 6-dehydrogenase